MGKQIDDLVLLAILQNQIKNAIAENKVDTEQFVSFKTINDVSTLTDEQKNDIGENGYKIIYDSSDNSIYTLNHNYGVYDWLYNQVTYRYIFSLSRNGLARLDLRLINILKTDINDDVIETHYLNIDGTFVSPQSFNLVSEKYPNVVFQANYFNEDNHNIYHFSSGIILDSTGEAPQYKIVFASYDISASKVTFVEKVLT